MVALPRGRRRLNLAIIARYFPPCPVVGGAELQAQEWARRLSVRHRVTVISRGRTVAREDHGDYRVLRVPSAAPPEVRGWREIAELAAVDRHVAGITPKPDLLLCFMTAPAGVAGVVAGRRRGIPAVVWIRADAEYLLDQDRRRRMIAPRVWSAATGLLVQSDTARRDLIAQLERAVPHRLAQVRRKLAVVGNGVELQAPSPPPADGPVLSVGRLVADKGMDSVIDACAALARPLVIAGEGPDRTELEARAAAAGADVRFTGFVDRAELAELYRAASVVVLASRREGLPNVVLEAMAHGRAVVTTPTAGIRSLITDGLNGLLVPPGDTAALVGALIRLADDRRTSARLTAAASETVANYEWGRVQTQLEAALERWRRR